MGLRRGSRRACRAEELKSTPDPPDQELIASLSCPGLLLRSLLCGLLFGSRCFFGGGLLAPCAFRRLFLS